MPSLAAKVAVVMEDEKEPWPENAQLFMPYEVEQITLPDAAYCLAVRAVLNFWKLPYNVEMRWNAEWMSPTGRVPMLRCGKFLLTDLESVAEHCKKRNLVPADMKFDPESPEMGEMRTYISLVNNLFYNAELYICWVHDETYNTVTSKRYASVFPWPLSIYQNFTKRWKITSHLNAFKWYHLTLEDVLEKVEMCCSSLAERLGTREYFFGSEPTELDALVFGHMFAIITLPLPGNHLANIVNKFKPLVDHTKRIDGKYFNLNKSGISTMK